jgi:septal ring factor EnvC (AmiA/AmiB activator)
MSALDQLWAPDVLPNIYDDGYQAVLAILEDHPVTAGMNHSARASLAQRCVNVCPAQTRIEKLERELRDAEKARDEALTERDGAECRIQELEAEVLKVSSTNETLRAQLLVARGGAR